MRRDLRGSRYWDGVAAEWRRATPQRLWRAYCDALHADLIRRWLPAERVGRLLKTDLFDEVTSQGLYPVLEPAASSVVGIDLSVDMVRGAKSRYACLAAVGADVCRLPFADGVFDVIVSNSTLDHMDSMDLIEQGLAELQRVLRPGGRLLLTLDNLWHPIVALRGALPERLLQRLGLVPYHVGVTCAPPRLQRMVCGAGFDVLDVKALMHCPRLLAVWCGAILDRLAPAGARKPYVRSLMAMERLASVPTRFLSAHFVAVEAVKPPVTAVAGARSS